MHLRTYEPAFEWAPERQSSLAKTVSYLIYMTLYMPALLEKTNAIRNYS